MSEPKISNDGRHSPKHDDLESRGPNSVSELPGVEIDRHAEAKLVRKLDLHIIPITMLLYILSFLDRVNIGNARYTDNFACISTDSLDSMD
jgi:hypothetical protein